MCRFYPAVLSHRVFSTPVRCFSREWVSVGQQFGCVIVLGPTDVKLTFFLAAHIVLCFAFVSAQGW